MAASAASGSGSSPFLTTTNGGGDWMNAINSIAPASNHRPNTLSSPLSVSGLIQSFSDLKRDSTGTGTATGSSTGVGSGTITTNTVAATPHTINTQTAPAAVAVSSYSGDSGDGGSGGSGGSGGGSGSIASNTVSGKPPAPAVSFTSGALASAPPPPASAKPAYPPGTIVTTIPTTTVVVAADRDHKSVPVVVPVTAAPPVVSIAPGSSASSKTVDKRGSILIICTGGTFAMHRHADGVLRPTVNKLEAMLRSLDELKHPDIPTFDLVEWEEPMDSSDFSPACWVQLARQIEQNYYAYDGFVILHGTDTMGYTASALSFMLENLAKTVVLTGAMSPLEAPISDAKRNLIISMFVAANSEIPEVVIFFDSVLLRGNRSKKIDPWVTAAFSSPNLEPLGEMGVKVSFRRNIFLSAPRGRFRTHTQLFSNIAVMVMIPGFDDTVLHAFVTASKGQCAVILCLYGAGNAPTKKKEFLDVIRYAREQKNAVIVIMSQCLRGSVDMTQYATGIQLSQMGVIDGKDMTTEACVTKLAYLMGRGLSGNQLKTAMESNLRGELTVNEKRNYAQTNTTSTPEYLSKL